MKSVLVVDFNEENLLLTQNILKSKYKVLTANSLKTALSIFKNSKPGIVLINYVMPNSSGVKILKKLCKKDKNFLAIMMSNAKDMEVVIDAILKGFDGFIKIPIEIEKFNQQIVKAKEIHQMRTNANNYLKVKATKAMSITFAHYTRNLLTPLIGYLITIRGLIPENIYRIFDKNLNRIDKLTYKVDELIEKGELVEYSYTDGTEFYDIKFDD